MSTSRYKQRLGWSAAIAVAVLTFMSNVSHAGPIYSFTEITSNSPINVASQLTVEVIDAGPGQVLFTFRNNGPLASSIADVYFDDGTLLGISSITNMTGVSFSQFAAPRDLPGGNNIDPRFQTTKGFSADSDAPVQQNGVNPGEQLGVLFNLINGQGYASILAALDLGLSLRPGDNPTGALRIGVHVQGLPDEDSESYVNGGVVPPTVVPPNVLPEPASLAVWGLGLLLTCGVQMRRRRRKDA